MKITVVLSFIAGIIALAMTAFISSNTSLSGDKHLLSEFQALFPKKDFPLEIDSTFLCNATQKEPTINGDKFKKLVPAINTMHRFSRLPATNSYYAITRVKETGKYSVFAYLKYEDISRAKWQGYYLHLVSLSDKGEQIDDKIISIYRKSDRNQNVNNDKYKEVTFNADNTVTQAGEGSVFTFSEKGEIIEKSSGGIVKK